VFGYGAVGAPRGITVAWSLTRPKSGPALGGHIIDYNVTKASRMSLFM